MRFVPVLFIACWVSCTAEKPLVIASSNDQGRDIFSVELDMDNTGTEVVIYQVLGPDDQKLVYHEHHPGCRSSGCEILVSIPPDYVFKIGLTTDAMGTYPTVTELTHETTTFDHQSKTNRDKKEVTFSLSI